MFNNFFNKTISIILVLIFITGLFPVNLFSQPNPSPFNEVKGFNSSIFENHFSKADREINPERWLSEAKFGITQAICVWELTAEQLYDNPEDFNEAKNQLTQWSEQELEKRFSQWLIGRFLGKAAADAFINLSYLFNETQKKYTWRLDEEGNIIFDDQTGDPLVIRPNDEDREFSQDLILWRNEADKLVETTSISFENVVLIVFPELLTYIPHELRGTMGSVINSAINLQSISLRNEFKNIAAREEKIFSNRRTRDIWSLRNKSENESARIFTDKLIAETEESCKKGIEELNTRIEQAASGSGDLAILGEEWLRLYQEQFDRGLKAWEDAEERFFIRRIEWEQDSLNLFKQGDDTWLAAFYQFEEERNRWELTAKELFEAGEKTFNNISEDFIKAITDAKKEFELNKEMRIGEGKTKVKALIDVYLLCSSAAFSALDNYNFWTSKENVEEMQKSYNMYSSYLDKASDARKRIMENYAELFGTGALKDILSPGVSSEDFYLDDCQIALIKAQALVFYWERKTKIAESVMSYAVELTAGRLTEAEGVRAWEEAKSAYNNSLLDYEAALEKLNDIGTDIHSQMILLNELSEKMKIEEEKLDKLNSDYSALISISAGNLQSYYYTDFNVKYDILSENYKSLLKNGTNAVYKNVLEYGIKWDIAEKQEAVKIILNSLVNGSEDFRSLAELESNVSSGKDSTVNLQIRYAAIDLFSDSIQNSVEWYTKVKGLTLTDKEKEDIFGKKLYDRLKEDYTNISILIHEKKLEYESTDVKESSLPALEVYLAQYYDELNFCEGLLKLFTEYYTICPFIQEEIWQESCNSMALLLKDYGFEQINTVLPDIKNICEAIIKKPGEIINNASNFLIEFEDCFSVIPRWIEYEMDIWKESFLSYFTAYIFNNNIQPENNSNVLLSNLETLQIECITLYEMIYSQNAVNINDTKEINNLLMNKLKKTRSLEYIYQITELWESFKKSSLSEDKHWREYLSDNNIINKNPSLKNTTTWKEGILLDTLFCANYFTNRINDLFKIISNKNIKTENTAEYYFYLYSDEVVKNIISLNSLNTQYIEIASAARAYEYSNMVPENIKIELKHLENELIKQEKEYNFARNEYYKEAEKFLSIGSAYDEQYNKLKQTHDNTDQKRFEYEIQDAIQRWASTSYLNTDNIDLENNKNKLSRAQTILSVLSDIYNKNGSSSNDPEYESLYSAYKQSFSMKMKVLEAVDSVSFAIVDEYKNNAALYSNYRTSLYQLGNPDRSMFNNITVKDGLLAFTDSNTDTAELNNFFISDEQDTPSQYELSLRVLSERMSTYFEDPNKFTQWSLARDFLLLTLMNSNENYKFLDNYHTGMKMFKEDGSIGKLTIKTGRNPFKKTKIKLHESSIIAAKSTIYEILCQDSWNKLSEEEKKDLEYYTILTLSNSNDYSNGFGKMYTYQTTVDVKNTIEKLIISVEEDDHNLSYIFFGVGLIFSGLVSEGSINEMLQINNYALSKVKPVHQELKTQVENWTTKLKQNLALNQTNALNYKNSCEKLNLLENKKEDGSFITWEDINLTLRTTGKINNNDITEIKIYWEKMQKNSYQNFSSVSQALLNLFYWTEKEESKSKTALETYWINIAQTQQANIYAFQKNIESYISGSTSYNELKKAANNAYGNNLITSKYHLNNMHAVIMDNLWTYEAKKTNFTAVYHSLGNEMVKATEKIMNDRYNAELNARETEWEQQLIGLLDKYNEWQKSASLILSNGRKDWDTGLQKLETSYKQWLTNFQNEYERVNNEWAVAYLAGLEDKELWLEQAANAFNEASGEALLSLIGMEGERLSRFIDTREPLIIFADIPQTQTLMSELLQSSGIKNLSAAFGSLNNIANASSPLVKRGMGGISVWDASLVKTAASDLAKKTNKEIADGESKKLAYNARIIAEEAVKYLTLNVKTANKKFRDNMDETFIYNGLWSRDGADYVKDVLTGSTVFDPTITKKVTITGYADYVMKQIELKTNLDENYLITLDSIAVNMLLKNVYSELENISEEIFGDGEETPGEFGIHIGQAPEIKPNNELGKNRSDIFINEGTGELGRLISELIYWSVIECYGTAELDSATWDKRIWDDEGKKFSAPSLRIASTIAGSIAAAIVQSRVKHPIGLVIAIAINSTTGVVCGFFDACQEYRTPGEAAWDMTKTILISTATCSISALFNGVSGASGIIGTGLTNAATTAATNTLSTFGTIATQTLMAGLQAFTIGLTTSLLNGITYNSVDGFGYSTEILNDGLNGMLKNTLKSMASTFVTSGLTAINTGLKTSKVIGFNEMNPNDLQKLNSLLGSLAGEGVSYALGDDFTLNLLNLSLFSGNDNITSGLIELHLNRDGVSMNFGTGGANVSIDNIIHSIKGAAVWNVNTQIGRYIRNQSKDGGNNFNSAIALRAQYGYGDAIQKDQLWDILRGRTLIDTNSNEEYYALTTIDSNGNKIIRLSNYSQEMSIEEQFLLATILGHEAYRDGYITGQYNADGKFISNAVSFDELKNASIGRILMADRINNEQTWFYNLNEGLAYESILLDYARSTGNYLEFEDFLDFHYNNNADFQWIMVNNGANYQNIYKSVPLFNSELTKQRIAEVNEKRMLDAFERYTSTFTTESEWQNVDATYRDFLNNQKLQAEWGYRDVSTTSIAGYGCMFMSTKYGIEAITGMNVNLFDLHGFIKDNNYIVQNTDNLLSRDLMAAIMTAYTGGKYIVEYVIALGENPSIDTFSLVEASPESYLAHLRIRNPDITNAIIHSVMVAGIDYNTSETGQILGVNTIYVANPLRPSNHFNTRTSYIMSEIIRWDFFKVTQNRP